VELVFTKLPDGIVFRLGLGDKLSLSVRSFGVIWIRMSDPRSLGSWCIKETDESTLVMDSPVPLMHHDLSDVGSLILIIPKERTLIHLGNTSC